jgi:hypothetical protein
MKSELFTPELFAKIRDYDCVHLYGLKKFEEDYYPTKDIYYEKLMAKIISEDYLQIQFNYNNKELLPKDIRDKYFEIIALFESVSIKPINQLEDSIPGLT